MSNTYFQFKQFIINQDQCVMKVCTDACILGAWTAKNIRGPVINHVLDIGCGTGLLSLMLAQKQDVFIDAVEINKDAALQATKNVALSSWKHRVTVINCSIQEFITEKKYGLIICNPPFYEDDLRSIDENKNVAKHDTALTLDDLLISINKYLNDDGEAVVLLAFHRAQYFEDCARKRSLFVKERLLLKQTPGHDQFRSIVVLSKNEIKNINTSELIIHDRERNYTAGFEALLKDYYLKF